MLDSLNAEYASLIKNDLSIDEAYSKMVESRPRRILSKHDYNNNGVPFRSARCAQEPKETDVSNEKKKFYGTFVNYILFLGFKNTFYLFSAMTMFHLGGRSSATSCTRDMRSP